MTAQASQRGFVRLRSRAKRVRFFRNGDLYFKGVWYAVSCDRFRSFEALLEDLNRAIGDLVNLPHGVRCIFSTDGLKRVLTLDQLVDGQSYVCCSSDAFKRVDYEKARQPLWCYGTNYPNGSNAEAARPTMDASRRGFTTLAEQASFSVDGAGAGDFVYPKIVTIVRNGIKPRRVVRLLLNKRTARSFEHVLRDVTSLVKLDSGAVRKLYSLEGKLMTKLCEFFREDDIFIACGSERATLDDLLLDAEEYKFLYSSKYKPPATRQLAAESVDKPAPLTARIDPASAFKARQRLANGYNSESPEIRRKFLSQKGSAGIYVSQQVDAINDSTTASTDSCLNGTTASSHFSPVYPLEIEDRFKIGRIIGDGNFAVVHECIDRRTRDCVALKVVDKEKCTGKIDMIENEISIMKRLSHCNIIKFVDFFDVERYFFIAMECIKGGDLFDALIGVRYYSEHDAALLMQSLLRALQYIHERNIVHRDVKPENLLVYEDAWGRRQLKIADFGLATYCHAHVALQTICGTPTYVAPEILTEQGYGFKIDIWAAGVIMYIMLCGFPPFVSASNNQEELFEMILSGEYSFPRPYWDTVSATAKTLIQAMLQLSPELRFSAGEALGHVWIRQEGKLDDDLETIFKHSLDEGSSDRKYQRVPRPIDSDSSDLDSTYGQQNDLVSRRRSLDELSAMTSEFPGSWDHFSAPKCGNQPKQPGNSTSESLAQSLS